MTYASPQIITKVNTQHPSSTVNWKEYSESIDDSIQSTPLKPVSPSSLQYRICKSCNKPVALAIIAEHIKECIESKKVKPKPAMTSEPTKKRKAETPLPKKVKKVAAPKKKGPKGRQDKGPVDVDKQCGVPLPDGSMCSRSLTCKTHPMGAKRAVPGRSQPFDVLLSQYQKRNQIKGTAAKTKLKEEAEVVMETLSPEEETTQVLGGIQRSYAAPLENHVIVSSRYRAKYLRMREMFGTAITPRSGAPLNSFGSIHGRIATVDVDRSNDYTYRVKVPQSTSQQMTPQQMQKLQQQRMQMMQQQRMQQGANVAQQQQQAHPQQPAQAQQQQQLTQQQMLQQQARAQQAQQAQLQQKQTQLMQQKRQQQRLQEAASQLATAQHLMAKQSQSRQPSTGFM